MAINNEDIKKIRKEIEASNGWKISKKIEPLAISYYIFMGNYNH